MSTKVNNNALAKTVAYTISTVATPAVAPLAIAIGTGCRAGYAASKAWSWLMD